MTISRKFHAKTKRASSRALKSTKKPQIAPKITLYSPEFNQLQREWYKKAADKGLKDIEQPITSAAARTLALNGASLRNFADNFSPETRHYYAQLRCYLTFNAEILDVYGAPIGPTKRLAIEMYSEGVPYRAILKALKGRQGPALNLFSLSKLINYFVGIARHWNKVNFNGLDYISDIGP